MITEDNPKYKLNSLRSNRNIQNTTYCFCLGSCTYQVVGPGLGHHRRTVKVAVDSQKSLLHLVGLQILGLEQEKEYPIKLQFS